ncbi:helix-turn-helix domain-containing protein [Liquorilactobacillus satsumensis]|uniref:helix-turn-helix domain-containing protein n=1 Tax=Liquorilactobacillus satsumensis TaxID=259059 RepID=UPI0039E8858B
MTTNLNIGKKIRARRKELHITQEELAFESHTSVNYISRLERKNDPHTDSAISVGKLISIATALKVEPSSLLSETTSSKTNYQAELPYHANLLCQRFNNLDTQKLDNISKRLLDLLDELENIRI